MILVCIGKGVCSNVSAGVVIGIVVEVDARSGVTVGTVEIFGRDCIEGFEVGNCFAIGVGSKIIGNTVDPKAITAMQIAAVTLIIETINRIECSGLGLFVMIYMDSSLSTKFYSPLITTRQAMPTNKVIIKLPTCHAWILLHAHIIGNNSGKSLPPNQGS